MLAQLKQEKLRLTWKAKFIMSVIADDDSEEKIYVSKRSKKNIYTQLEKHKFPKEINKILVKLINIENIDESDDDKAYNYLLNMPIYSLTQELIDKLIGEKDKKEAEYNELKDKTYLQLWLDDLDGLDKAYDDYNKSFWKDNKDAETDYLAVMTRRSKSKYKFKTKLRLAGIESDNDNDDNDDIENIDIDVIDNMDNVNIINAISVN